MLLILSYLLVTGCLSDFSGWFSGTRLIFLLSLLCSGYSCGFFITSWIYRIAIRIILLAYFSVWTFFLSLFSQPSFSCWFFSALPTSLAQQFLFFYLVFFLSPGLDFFLRSWFHSRYLFFCIFWLVFTHGIFFLCLYSTYLSLLLSALQLPPYSLLGFPIAIVLRAMMRNGCFLLRIRVARNIDILAHLFAISIAQNVVIVNMNFALLLYCDLALLRSSALYTV